MPDPVVVVVAYGHPGDLAKCLDSVVGLAGIVVDNGSSDQVAAVVHARGFTYVDPGSNLGFGAGVNLALTCLASDAAFDHVLVLNPDARPRPGCVRTLVQHLEQHARCAVVSPRLVHGSDEEQRVWWPWPSPPNLWREAIGLAPSTRDFVVGAVMLLRKQALDQVGAFDERFFLYAEETDWQRRATAAGWSVCVAEDALAEHDGAGTSDDLSLRELLFHAAQETYIRKWYGWRGWASYRAAAIVGALLRLPSRSRSRSARVRLRIYARGPKRALADSTRT